MASQLIEEVTAHAQRDSLEDAREICADGAYFTNNLRIFEKKNTEHKMCVSILPTKFVGNISHSKRFSTRYCHKRT